MKSSIYWRGIEIKYKSTKDNRDKYEGSDFSQGLTIQVEIDSVKANVLFVSKYLGRYVVTDTNVKLALGRLETMLDENANALSWIGEWKGKTGL
jgi:hypothetical protein